MVLLWANQRSFCNLLNSALNSEKNICAVHVVKTEVVIEFDK